MPQKVTLGDCYEDHMVERRAVVLYSKLPSGECRKCKLDEVLHVPGLYSLLSVSMVSKLSRNGMRF